MIWLKVTNIKASSSSSAVCWLALSSADGKFSFLPMSVAYLVLHKLHSFWHHSSVSFTGTKIVLERSIYSVKELCLAGLPLVGAALLQEVLRVLWCSWGSDKDITAQSRTDVVQFLCPGPDWCSHYTALGRHCFLPSHLLPPQNLLERTGFQQWTLKLAKQSSDLKVLLAGRQLLFWGPPTWPILLTLERACYDLCD